MKLNHGDVYVYILFVVIFGVYACRCNSLADYKDVWRLLECIRLKAE